jgi:hypothetical protein
MAIIFISYRRSDSQDVTGRIYDRLVGKFTPKQVFKDVDNIPLGVSFAMHIQQMIGKTSVTLVIIGPGWLTATDEQGKRRLDDPGDFVRIEVESALRAGMPVVPVLVANAAMPKASELPKSIQKLVARNGIAVRPDPDFNNDITRLFSGIDHLERLLKPQQEKSAKGGKEATPTMVPATESNRDSSIKSGAAPVVPTRAKPAKTKVRPGAVAEKQAEGPEGNSPGPEKKPHGVWWRRHSVLSVGAGALGLVVLTVMLTLLLSYWGRPRDESVPPINPSPPKGLAQLANEYKEKQGPKKTEEPTEAKKTDEGIETKKLEPKKGPEIPEVKKASDNPEPKKAPEAVPEAKKSAEKLDPKEAPKDVPDVKKPLEKPEPKKDPENPPPKKAPQKLEYKSKYTAKVLGVTMGKDRELTVEIRRTDPKNQNLFVGGAYFIRPPANFTLRNMLPPVEFDDQGFQKKFTQKELNALRGNLGLPGYPWDSDSLKSAQFVEIYIGRDASDIVMIVIVPSKLP